MTSSKLRNRLIMLTLAVVFLPMPIAGTHVNIIIKGKALTPELLEHVSNVFANYYHVNCILLLGAIVALAILTQDK